MKKVLLMLFLSISLMFSGCGDSEGESRLETQQMLDRADYAGVIAKLEGKASSSEEFIALGAAYMGKAGLSLADIVSAMSSNDDSNQDDSGFGTFIDKISNKSTSTALADLGSANQNYKQVLGERCRDSNNTLSDSQKDICLYIALANTTRAAVAIDTLAEDVSKISEDSNGSDDKLTASTCAMQYASDGASVAHVDANCTITPDGNVTFSILEKTYDKFSVSVNGADYYYLMNDTNRTVLTKGFCRADSFTPRVDDYNATANPAHYACPINEDKDAEELTAVGLLTTVLNEGIDSIGGAAASDDISGDINEFKCDILGGNYDEFNGCRDSNFTSIDTTQEISEQQIIDYLNRENG
jgi:hypothetical protein